MRRVDIADLDEIAPVTAEIPKLQLRVVDEDSFAAWAAKNGRTAEEAWRHIVDSLTPRE